VCSTAGHDGWHLYLAVDAGAPIAGALMFVQGDGVWLGMGATLPEARRRGAQSALIAHRLREAARLNCRWATAETTLDTPERPNPSYRNMIRVGMQVLYHRAKYLFELDSLPAGIRVP
jgi:GNAT superfamily N-acetyltransferase